MSTSDSGSSSESSVAPLRYKICRRSFSNHKPHIHYPSANTFGDTPCTQSDYQAQYPHAEDQESSNSQYIGGRPSHVTNSLGMNRLLKGKAKVRASKSTRPDGEDGADAISMDTRSTSRVAKWPEQHNQIVGELLLEQFLAGNLANGNLRKDRWEEVTRALNRRASSWEGSAADMRVLRWTVEEGSFSVPNGKYYLADSGYANTNKFLAPFRGFRYHLGDYRGSTNRHYEAPQELFNHRHAQLRNVVERTFGIWKERFQVLSHMKKFPIAVQGDIVIACAVLHNFIGRYHGHDHYFNMSQTEMEYDRELGEVSTGDEDPNRQIPVGERVEGEVLRDTIANTMWEERDLLRRRRSG